MAYTTIDNPELYFQVKIWSGNATDDTAITLDGDENMQPDFVWTKRRNASTNHDLWDAVRGALKQIASNNTEAEATISSSVKSFDSDGFTVGTNSNLNASGGTYVAWCWKESATAGFDILTFTGNASGNQTISHNLSAVPKCWHIKRLDQASNWCTYHVGLGGANKNLFLNTNNSVQTDTGIWNNTLPTSSVFSVGNNIDANGSGASHVWYGWSDVQGYSKMFSFQGNGSTDGVYVHLGFSPELIIWTNATSSNLQGWWMVDAKRDTYNVADENLRPSGTGAASESYDMLDFTANGFKVRWDDDAINDSGETFVGMAFAKAPFVNSKGVPANAR